MYYAIGLLRRLLVQRNELVRNCRASLRRSAEILHDIFDVLTSMSDYSGIRCVRVGARESDFGMVADFSVALARFAPAPQCDTPSRCSDTSPTADSIQFALWTRDILSCLSCCPPRLSLLPGFSGPTATPRYDVAYVAVASTRSRCVDVEEFCQRSRPTLRHWCRVE